MSDLFVWVLLSALFVSSMFRGAEAVHDELKFDFVEENVATHALDFDAEDTVQTSPALDNSSNLANGAVRTKCCCEMFSANSSSDTRTSPYVLRCEWTELSHSSLFSRASCKQVSKRSVDLFPDGQATDSDMCPSYMLAGPAPADCGGATKGCTCTDTVDAVAVNGLLKGRVLTSGSGPRVAGFFNVAYGRLEKNDRRGRWKPAAGVYRDSEGAEARDHCSHRLEVFHQLRPGDHETSFCYHWNPVFGYIGGDDCFTLDVYTPSIMKLHQSPTGSSNKYHIRTDRKLPVMVYFFGGGYILGDKYQNGIYDGRKLAGSQSVIMVSVNYRLGVFGFLHHPSLKTPNNFLSTNLGLQDQQLALRWVQANVRAFGGDPSRVTLFGESAGAMSICAHLAAPSSRTLFTNVILQSFSCDSLFVWRPKEYALEEGVRYIRAVFGRIRGCAMTEKGGPDEDDFSTEYKEHYRWEQSGCAKSASLQDVADQCYTLFLGKRAKQPAGIKLIKTLLPFETWYGCDLDYGGCTCPNPSVCIAGRLPSGLDYDTALFECAKLLEPEHVWVNQFALKRREPLQNAGLLLRTINMDFTGLPSPPHLWWAPVVDLSASLYLDFGNRATGGGLMPLPMQVFQSDGFRPHGHRIIAGFNRDEGSLFSPLLASFYSNVDFTKKTLTLKDSADVLQDIVCADWRPSGHRPSDIDCAARVQRMQQEYSSEVGPSEERGSCCSKDPQALLIQRLLTDFLFACPALRFVRLMSTPDYIHTPVETHFYTFEVDDELPNTLPPLRDGLGAFHVAETLFVFGDDSGPGGNLPFQGGVGLFGIKWTAKDKLISNLMSSSWGAVGRNAAPLDWPTVNHNAAKLDGQALVYTTKTESGTKLLDINKLFITHHCAAHDALQEELVRDATYFA